MSFSSSDLRAIHAETPIITTTNRMMTNGFLVSKT